MSEYQYYEFQAVDRPLDEGGQAELRDLSSRASITAMSFTNHYEWGDFKGDPRLMMERYFDLFLYLANWGSRRLSIRFPARLVDIQALQQYCPDSEVADVRIAGAHAIVDVWRDEVEQDDWDDEASKLAALAPLRGDIMQGDIRVFYLIWLMAVENGYVDDDELEPLPGMDPLSGPLVSFTEFFDIDPDLVEAAIVEGAAATSPEAEREATETFIRSLPEQDKAALLIRLHDGDPHLGTELRRLRVQATGQHHHTGRVRRAAGELRKASRRIRADRHHVAAEKAAAENRRREEERALVRKKHLSLLTGRGDAPWRDVEELISLRNQPGYQRAVTLLIDLCEVARLQGSEKAFARRLSDIRSRHDRKGRFMERLDEAGLR